MRRRVVVTGLGVIAPNANTVEDFEAALREGRSGIRRVPLLKELKFACLVAGVPQGIEALAEATFRADERMAMNSGITYACLAAHQAWRSAGLTPPDAGDDSVDWDTGAVIGSGVGGLDTVGECVVPLTDSGRVRRLGSTCVERVMSSGVSAKIGGVFGLGNQVTTNSSACSTGTEAILIAAERIRRGLAERMLAGGSEGDSPYIWAGFDAMRVLARGFNESPDQASRPMSATAAGFVPAAGAGVLMLESLDSAVRRGTTIHAEVLGGAVNCGGHRMGGSMTAPNPIGARRCICAALEDAGVSAEHVDAIGGHLTATYADPLEVDNWAAALGRGPGRLPMITATKSLIGHALGASGAIESIAAILMLRGGFVHAAINCEDLHREIEPFADAIPHCLRTMPDLNVLVKASFGFGDVNACLVLRRWAA